MLCSLGFLAEGQAWPPPSECGRLERYEKNRLLFEGRHELVYSEQFKRIERVIGNFNDVISYPMVLNFQKIISLKTADLLFGEEPEFLVGGEVIDASFIESAYEAAIDVSRYGTGLFYLYMDAEDKKPGVSVTQPSYWFPVVSEGNIKRTLYHVIAYETETDGGRVLKAAVHEKGFVSLLSFALEGSRLGRQLSSSGRISTGFRDFAIIPVSNITASEEVFGLDDYTDLDGIISEIEVRTAQIARILDKHSNPSMTGPSSALSRDDFGNWVFKGGSYIPNDTLDLGQQGDIKYITWDAQLASNFEQIELLMNMLYVISECGATLLGASKNEGHAQSGTALKLRMMSPLAKVKRIKLRFNQALKTILSELYGTERENVAVSWRDGLPIDDVEQLR